LLKLKNGAASNQKNNVNDNVKSNLENNIDDKSKPNIFQVCKELKISPMELLDFPLPWASDSMKITLILTWRAIEEARRRHHKDGKRFQPQ